MDPRNSTASKPPARVRSARWIAGRRLDTERVAVSILARHELLAAAAVRFDPEAEIHRVTPTEATRLMREGVRVDDATLADFAREIRLSRSTAVRCLERFHDEPGLFARVGAGLDDGGWQK